MVTIDWWIYGGLGFFAVLLLVLVLLGRVPVEYNARNLIVRWRISAMTGAIFILVTALLVVMLSFVNGMYELTKGSPPGQRHHPVRRRHRRTVQPA